jgi:hypothetical protein
MASKPALTTAPAAPVPAPFAADFLSGLTRTNCAAGCNEKGCVISQRNRCAHPCKGGLGVDQQQDLAALERLQAAKRRLALPTEGALTPVAHVSE